MREDEKPWSYRARLVIVELNGREVSRFIYSGKLDADTIRQDTASIIRSRVHAVEADEMMTHPDRVTVHWHEVIHQ